MAKRIKCEIPGVFNEKHEEFIKKNMKGDVCIDFEFGIHPKHVATFATVIKPEGGWVVVYCYNTAQLWSKRSSAKKFYREGIECCEGSESERYTNVYFGIVDGLKIARD